MKLWILLLLFIASCNPLSEGQEGSYKGSNYNSGLTSQDPPTSGPAPVDFTQMWSFNSNNSAHYIYDPVAIEFTHDSARMIDAAMGFKDGSLNNLLLDESTQHLSILNNSKNVSALATSWTPRYSSLKYYWKLDEEQWNGNEGEVKESISNLHGRAPNGLTSTTGKIQGAGHFQTNQYIDIGNKQNFNFIHNTGIFTISAWAKLDDHNVLQQRFILGNVTSSSNKGFFLGFHNTDGKKRLHFALVRGVGGKATVDTYSANNFIVDNEWHHYVVTSNGSSVQFYLDGAKVGNAVPYSYPLEEGDATFPLRIGATSSSSGPNGLWTGKIDEVAIGNADLSEEEVKHIYDRQTVMTSGIFTSQVYDTKKSVDENLTLHWSDSTPNEDNLSHEDIAGLWRFDEGFWNGTDYDVLDESGFNNHGRALGVTRIVPGKFNGAADFNGSSQYITVPDSDALDGANQMSFSAWVFPRKLDASPRAILAKRASVTNNFSYGIYFHTNNKLYVDLNSQNDRFNSSMTFTQARWYHVTVVFDGNLPAEERAKIYVNGKLDTTAHESSGLIPNTASAFTIGFMAGGSASFIGSIDEVAVWKRALEADEINELYKRGVQRIRLKIRTCDSQDCSDASGSPWIDPDPTQKSFNLTSRYFQYQALLETDDENISPSLESVWADPSFHPTSAPIINKIGVEFSSLTDFSSSFEDEKCAQEAGFNLGIGKSSESISWYWWNGTAWDVTSDQTKFNTSSEVQANINKFLPSVEGKFFFKVSLPLIEQTPCALKEIQLKGKE